MKAEFNYAHQLVLKPESHAESIALFYWMQQKTFEPKPSTRVIDLENIVVCGYADDPSK